MTYLGSVHIQDTPAFVKAKSRRNASPVNILQFEWVDLQLMDQDK